MKGEIWQEDQPVLRDDLALAQSSKEDAITDRQRDTFVYGIVSDSQFLAELIPFEITVNALPYSVDIGTGVAYSPAGERVVVSSLLTYDSLLPTTITDNGISGTTLTPQSSGSITVPLVSGQVNYIYVSYLQTIGPTNFSLQDGTNKRLFTEGDDGYVVEVVADPGPIVGDPDLFKPNANAIFLGVIDTTQVITLSARPIYNLKQNNLLAEVPDAVSTLSALSQPYIAGQVVSHETHVSAVGTGLVTPVNPHGLAIADLTGSFAGKTSELHEKLFHESGISGSQASITSGLYGFPVDSAGAPIAPTFARDNFIIKKLLVTEAVQVNGVTIASADLPEDFLFYFVDASGNFLDNGTYTIYLDSLTKTLKLAASGSPTNTAYRVYGVTSGTFLNLNTTSLAAVTASSSNFLLWEVLWDSTGSGLGNDNFIGVVDKRYFGTIGSQALRRDAETDTVTVTHNVEVIGDTSFVGDVSIVDNHQLVIVPANNANAITIRDSGDTLDAITLNEKGLTTTQDVYVVEPQMWFASVITTGSTTFNVALANFSGFDGNPPAAGTTFRMITATISAYTHVSAGSTSGINTFQSTSPGSPFNGTNPAQGIFMNPAIGDNITINHSVSGGGTADVTYLFTAYK